MEQTKDYIEKIDFQDPFFAVVNWPISEFYGVSVCIMHYFDQSAKNQLANVFLIAGCGFLQILIQNTRFYGVKLGPMRYLFMKEEKKFKTRTFMVIPIFPTPIISDKQIVGWRGILKLSFLADSSQ